MYTDLTNVLRFSFVVAFSMIAAAESLSLTPRFSLRVSRESTLRHVYYVTSVSKKRPPIILGFYRL